MTAKDVAGELGITLAQTYALLRSGDIPSVKIKGRYSVSRATLEATFPTQMRLL